MSRKACNGVLNRKEIVSIRMYGVFDTAAKINDYINYVEIDFLLLHKKQ